MYSCKIPAVVWLRHGDRLSLASPAKLLSARSLIPKRIIPNPSPSDGSSLLLGQLQRNQVRFSSIRTIFKLWRQQKTVLPIVFSKMVMQDREIDPSTPSSIGKARGGGGFGSDIAKKRVSPFGCSYVRHVSEQGKDNENLDVEMIEVLIEERIVAKKFKNFERADAIREELKNVHGVYLNDREHSWGISPSIRRSLLGFSNGQSMEFGPRGHDYQLFEDAGPSISPLSENEIHKLLAERLRCKLDGKFERADEIKYELFVNDVCVDDKNKLWRADGVRIYVAGGRGRSGNLIYTYDPDAGPSEADMSDEEVTKLLAVRREYRYHRSFETADVIRIVLEEAGVYIDDDRRVWRADGKSYRPEKLGF